ncbi:MAG: hypothetical protein OEM49_12810, partial [Myxococcales bacterium]|nr:hypothetical protein [Myxococcales bacterium]
CSASIQKTQRLARTRAEPEGAKPPDGRRAPRVVSEIVPRRAPAFRRCDDSGVRILFANRNRVFSPPVLAAAHGGPMHWRQSKRVRKK